jgi:enediyne biosynthesis protein E4
MAVLLFFLGSAHLPSALPAGTIHFTEVSLSYQVRGYSYFGSKGCSWVDVDNDGKLDLFVKVGQGVATPRNVSDILYINHGTYFADEAVARGISHGYAYGTHGAVFAPLFGALRNFDAFVTTTYGGVHPAIDRLYRNLGTGFFEDATSSIVPAQTQDHVALGVAVADFDRDGDLDLYFSNPLPNPFDQGSAPSLGLPNFLVNNGLGTFIPMYRGIEWTAFVAGVAAADLDGDGDIDLAEAKWLAPSTIYLNDGAGNFRDAGNDWQLPQSDIVTQKNGVSFGDIDNDGDMDLAIVGERVASTLVGSVFLYKNEGDRFVISQRIDTSRTQGNRVGYQVSFGDFDHDGYLDMYFGGENVYRNDGTGLMIPVPLAVSGMAASFATVDPRGIGLGDFDGDGDLDIYLTDTAGPNLLFRNDINNSDWLQVEIASDPTGAVAGFGSKVDLFAAGHLGERAYLKGHREIQGEYGFCGQDQPIAHFGAPSAGGARYDILVTFLDGKTKSILNVRPGQKIQVAAIFPPLDLAVTEVENKALFYRETIFELSWKANPLNLSVAKYRLYDVTQAQALLGEFPGTQLATTLRNMDGNRAYRFALTAVDEWGGESDPTYATSAARSVVNVSRRPASGKILKVDK